MIPGRAARSAGLAALATAVLALAAAVVGVPGFKTAPDGGDAELSPVPNPSGYFLAASAGVAAIGAFRRAFGVALAGIVATWLLTAVFFFGLGFLLAPVVALSTIFLGLWYRRIRAAGPGDAAAITPGP